MIAYCLNHNQEVLLIMMLSNSEYTNSLVKKEALERALTEGIQLMNIVVQSKITE